MQQAPQNLWVPLLIAGIILAGLVGSFFFPPLLVWGGIMVAMFGAILLGQPRALLFILWLWAAFRPLLLQMVDNPIMKASNGVFVVALIGICIAFYIQRRTDSSGIVRIWSIVIALLGVTLASVLVNFSPVVSSVWFFVNYLSFPFVFFVAYAMLDRRHWHDLVRAIVGLVLIQFALNHITAELTGQTEIKKRQFLSKIS